MSDGPRVIHFRSGEEFLNEDQPDADLILECEELLRRAKAGEIRAIAYAAFGRANKYVTRWAGYGSPLRLIGLVRYLEKRMLEHLPQD